MAIPQIPDLLRAVLAHSADVEAIPDTTPTGQGVFSYRDGWPVITEVELEAGGIAPDRKFFNEINRLLSAHIFFSQSGNVYPWVGASESSPGLNYLRGAHVLGSDYQEYVAKKPSGPEIPAEGGGFVGPVNPVGDASGVWMPVFNISTVEKNGICRPDNVTIGISSDGQLSAITADNKKLITVTAYYAAGVYNWVVPDLKGDGKPWLGWIRIKGSGAAGGASYLSGTRQGGRGGGEGTTVMRYVRFVPGETHVLTVGSGGVAVIGGDVTNGNSTSFGSITFAPGAGSTKAPTADELMVPGAVGAYGQSNYNDSNLSQTYGAPGAGTSGGLPGADGKYGGGGGGGIFKFQVTTPSLGGRGGDGFIEIFRMD